MPRYLNHHEDLGGLSLALGRRAIASVQAIPIPAPNAFHPGWVRIAADALGDVKERQIASNDALSRIGRFKPSLRALAGRELAEDLAARLPINLQWKFTSAVTLVDGADPERW